MSECIIGRHLGMCLDFWKTPLLAKELGCEIFQIFLGNPQSNQTLLKKPSDLEKMKLNLESTNTFVVVHGAYTINLSNDFHTSKFKSSVRRLTGDLMMASEIGERCKGVIVHMGKNTTSIKNPIRNFIYGIKLSLKLSPLNTILLIENGAGQGNEIGSNIDNLKFIYQKLSPDEQIRVGFCLDTCHLWANGIDIGSKEKVRKFFEEFDEKIGIRTIRCIHFNNSKNELGSKVDRHEDLKTGLIPLEGLNMFAQLALKYKIPIVLETPSNTETYEEQKKMISSNIII